MKRIASIVRKEFLQVRRDHRMLPLIFIAPVLQLVLLGYAANLDVKEVPVVVCDLDGSKESRALTESLSTAGHFVVREVLRDQRGVDELLDRGEVQLALVLPRGFASNLQAGKTAQVQLIADGSDSNSAGIGFNYAVSTLRNYSKNLFVERFSRAAAARNVEAGEDASRPAVPGTAVPEIRVWYNPELKSRLFFVTGILGLLLMIMTMLLTSLAIVKEKEKGTLEQLIVTPIRSVELIVGKLIPFVIIGFIDVVLIVLAIRLLFGIRVAGSVPLLFGLTGVFLLTTLGLGLFISTITRTQQQAMNVAVFFVLMPMIFLSGFVFPIDNMPIPIQGLSYLIPLRYYFVIIRGIFLKGAGMEALLGDAAALLAFGLLILGFSVLRFRKRLE